MSSMQTRNQNEINFSVMARPCLLYQRFMDSIFGHQLAAPFAFYNPACNLFLQALIRTFCWVLHTFNGWHNVTVFQFSFDRLQSAAASQVQDHWKCCSIVIAEDDQWKAHCQQNKYLHFHCQKRVAIWKLISMLKPSLNTMKFMHVKLNVTHNNFQLNERIFWPFELKPTHSLAVCAESPCSFWLMKEKMSWHFTKLCHKLYATQ